MTDYYRICKSVADKGILVPEGTDISKYKKGEAYISVFKYSKEHKEQFEKTGTISGITDVKGDTLFFDFDSPSIENARKDTIEAVNRLSEHFNKENFAITFTTGKGFHLALHLDKNITPNEAKTFASNVCADLKTFDSSVYNAARIIRIEGSLHPKTKLRKLRINEDELINMPIHEMKEVAQDEYAYDKPNKCKVTAKIKQLMKKVEKKEVKKVASSDAFKVDYLSNPLNLSPWKLALSQGLFPNGQRNNALTILAATYRGKGLDETQAYYNCKAAADLQSQKFGTDKFGKKEIYQSINQVYSSLWNGGSYSEDNFSLALQNFFEENGIPRKDLKSVADTTEDISTSFDEFIGYAENIEKNTMRFGIESLDAKLKARKGHLIGLLAGPGIGKTSFALTLLNNCSKSSNRCLFYSFDMYKFNVISKLIGRHTGLSEDEIYQAFLDKDQTVIDSYKTVLSENYENVSFCYKSGMSVEEIKKSIKLEEDKIGEEIELVIVDYLELVETEKSDPTASSAEAINGLREIANMGKVVVVLLQPNKISSRPDEPLLSYNAAKGSSMIAQAVTAMLTCHRPGYSSETPQNDKYFSINCVKNRNGGLFSLDFAWDGPTQTISDLDDKEKFFLKQLRDLKKEVEDDL